jgi:hypothetical protein
MLPLDQVKHRNNSVTIQASNSFLFMIEPMTCKDWLDALIMSLAKNVCHVKQLLPWLLEGEACHMNGVHQHIFE